MEEQWQLPQKYWLYKKAYQLLRDTRELFSSLLLQYKLCLKCILRMYSFEYPKIYNDPEFYVEILPELLGDPSLMKEYDVVQNCMKKTCWLCQQIFQKSYSNRVVLEVKEQIALHGFQSYQQFKLNVRIPNIILLRTIILSRFLYFKYAKEGLQEKQLNLYYTILVLPYEANKFIDPKAVIKWILANQLNNQTQMTSTAEDYPSNLIISIEQEFEDAAAQSNLIKLFRSSLGLEKKKDKTKGRKQCLDLGDEGPQDYRCSASNMAKIANLKQNQFENVFTGVQGIDQFWKLVNGSQQTTSSEACFISHKITLFTKNVYLCGRYIKFSRYLSQTPWMVNGKKLTEGSLQQEIEDKIFALFYPGKKKEQIETKFHAGGREDIDVRMLKGGRPFVLQLVNPIRSIKTISEEEAIALIPEEGKKKVLQEFQGWLNDQKESDEQNFHSWRIVKLLELIINYENAYVQVLDFQETTQSFISVQLKAAEIQKIKHYLCYIHSSEQLVEEDKIKLDSLKNIVLQQLTPLRVLHRRTLMIRDKIIHSLRMHLVSRHSAILEVWASAGTYIKEFVHGDLGRTTPNVGSLLGKEVDILQLDVGSLKEGQWAEGDEHLMKLEKLEWMQ